MENIPETTAQEELPSYENYYDSGQIYYELPEYYTERRPPPRRRSKILGPAVAILVICIMLAALLLTPLGKFLLGLLTPEEYRLYPESAKFTLQNHIIISSAPDYSFDLPVPLDLNTYEGRISQIVLSVNSTPPYATVSKYSRPWMVWYNTPNIRIYYYIKTYSIVWDYKAEDSGTVEDIPMSLIKKYNNSEWQGKNGRFKIDPSETEITRRANQVTVGKPTVYEKVKAIYDYIVANIVYVSGYQNFEPKDALTVLEEGSGDCDEQSFLFASMCRAAGIPAWLELGVFYDKGSGLWTGHAWTEFYLPFNSTAGESITVDVVNQQFMFRDCLRFSDYKDDGNGSHLEDYYTILTSGDLTQSYTTISYTEEGSIKVPVSVHGNFSFPEDCIFYIIVVNIRAQLIFGPSQKKLSKAKIRKYIRVLQDTPRNGP